MEINEVLNSESDEHEGEMVTVTSWTPIYDPETGLKDHKDKNTKGRCVEYLTICKHKSGDNHPKGRFIYDLQKAVEVQITPQKGTRQVNHYPVGYGKAKRGQDIDFSKMYPEAFVEFEQYRGYFCSYGQRLKSQFMLDKELRKNMEGKRGVEKNEIDKAGKVKIDTV